MIFEDILYEKDDGVATITFNRPEVLNAFRALTVSETIEALKDAWEDRSIGVVIMTGSGDKAFCTGGDQSIRTDQGYEGCEGKRSRSDIGVDVEELQLAIRDIPKPVIAAVNGYAIGGGNVLQVLCDLSIAADTARFGQVGPRVGSVDPGFGTAYLARLVGERKAREMWFLCEKYTAAEALEMGLVNKVVPADELMTQARAWARRILKMSPVALKIAKASFNADSDQIRGISAMGMAALALYYGTGEAMEGRNAFSEKREPDFGKYRR